MSRIPPVDPGHSPGQRQIVEIVAVAVLNIRTNDLNRVAATDIDFPAVRARVSNAA